MPRETEYILTTSHSAGTHSYTMSIGAAGNPGSYFTSYDGGATWLAGNIKPPPPLRKPDKPKCPFE